MDEQTLGLIRREAREAEERYGPFTSAHEALGVLLEEFQELTEAICDHSADAVRREAIQVAAVALRLAGQCGSGDEAFLKRSGL